MKQSTPHNEPEYSAVRACVMALVRPVAAVRRADHLPLWKAWCVHVVGMAMCLASAICISALDKGPDLVVEEVLEGLTQPSAWAVFFMYWLFTEVGFLIAAAIMMSWSARDEKFRFSYVRSLRRIYLITPHSALLMLAVALWLIFISEVLGNFDWLPFELESLLEVSTLIASGLWQLGVLLRAVGIDKPAAMSRWPARCFNCGYQLLGLSLEQGCPECGEKVSDSLDPEKRPGIHEPGGVLWWLRLSIWSVRHPSKLGQSMHVLDPDRAYRRCLIISLISQILLAIVSVKAWEVYIWLFMSGPHGGEDGTSRFFAFIYFALMIGGILGWISVTFTTIGALLCSSVIGTWQGRRNERNLMPTAIRAACYQSGWFLIVSACWLLDLAIFTILILMLMFNESPADRDRILLLLCYAGLYGIPALGLFIYWLLIARATRAARFANW